MIGVIIFLFLIVLVLDAASGSKDNLTKRAKSEDNLTSNTSQVIDMKAIKKNVEMSLREKRFGYKAMEARKLISEALKRNPGIRTEEELLKEVLNGK